MMNRKLLRKSLALVLAMSMIIAPAADPVAAEFETVVDEASENVSAVESEIATEEESDEPVEETGDHEEAEMLGAAAMEAGGYLESIYAEISGVSDEDITAVSWTGTASGSLEGDDLTYLVREIGDKVRIDIPGLSKGTYTLNVTAGGSVLTKSGITVEKYDRSGFAHFNYSDGVGAYKDDGTLKSGAKILYVTDSNKNDVELSYKGKTVKGIGNILNSVGQESATAGAGLCSNGGTANSNQGIIKDLAKDGIPLVVRFIGVVSDSGLYERGTFPASNACRINGLTEYNTSNYGGTKGDNGHMARIQSGKDITLEGIGYDATIDGWGFHMIAQTSDPELGKSFEVRNLSFINTPEDAVGMEGQQDQKNASSVLSASVERCWVHNNEFYCPHISNPAESDKSEGDGSVDFKRGMYFTCSYNYFDSCHKTNLVGSADYSLQFNLTYHHNYWFMCKARGPLTRRANVHMYNNIWEMQTDYCQNTRADAYVFSEYNQFYACKSPEAVEGGAIKSYRDNIASVIWNKGTPATVVEDKTEYVPNNCQYSAGNVKYDKFDVDSDLSYIPDGHYDLDEDFKVIRQKITAYAHPMRKDPVIPEEVTSDAYSLITRSKAEVAGIDLPMTTLPGKSGKISKTAYGFSVGGEFDITVEYADSTKAGCLVNEEGINLLDGNGTATNLPAGRYMIQPINVQPGDPAKGDTFVTFKEFTLSSISITATDPDKHYHKWDNGTVTKEPSCEEAGVKTYTCTSEGCTTPAATRTETIAALGHSWGSWTVTKEATETEDGIKERRCLRDGCDAVDTQSFSYDGGTSGGDDPGNVITPGGEFVLHFAGKTINNTQYDGRDFFTFGGKKNLTNLSAAKVINGDSYDAALKIESATTVIFTSNDGASLYLVADAGSKKIKIDGNVYTTDADGILELDLAGGEHIISKGDTLNLVYLSVSNGAQATHTVIVDYDDEADDKELLLPENSGASAILAAVKKSVSKTGYSVEGIYTDPAFNNELGSDYRLTGDITVYVNWEKTVVSHLLTYDPNGGDGFSDNTVAVREDQVYILDKVPTRSGYSFAGWFDAKEGGNMVNNVDGSSLTANMTVYAHWNASSVVSAGLELDCSELTAGDITATGKLGDSDFIAHVLPGGVGTAGSENPKYYMTVKEKKLYTNGVLLDDKTIEGNEQGLLKAIEFTTEAPGELTANVALSGSADSSKTYSLVLGRLDESGSLIDVQTIDVKSTGKTLTDRVFTVDAAGTYYLYAKGAKGVMYSSLKFGTAVYTLNYKASKGNVTGADTSSKKAGDEVTLPACDGAGFKGWSLDGETVVEGDKYTVAASDARSGVITLTALYDDVNIPVTGLSLSPSEDFELYVDESAKIAVNVIPADATDRSVTWESDKPEVASVDEGLVKALAKGEAVITAKSGNATKSLKITVKEHTVSAGQILVTVRNKELARTDFTTQVVTAGSTVSFNASPAKGYKLLTVSVNDIDGVIIPVASEDDRYSFDAGNKNIILTFDATVIKVTRVNVVPASMSLEVGERGTIAATADPIDAKDKTLTYTSSDESIATVTGAGVVKAIASGSARITVTAAGGAKAEVPVTVKEMKTEDGSSSTAAGEDSKSSSSSTAAGEENKNSSSSTAAGEECKSSSSSTAAGEEGKGSSSSTAAGEEGKGSSSSSAAGEEGKGSSSSSSATGEEGKGSSSSSAAGEEGKSSSSSTAAGEEDKGSSSTAKDASGSSSAKDPASGSDKKENKDAASSSASKKRNVDIGGFTYTAVMPESIQYTGGKITVDDNVTINGVKVGGNITDSIIFAKIKYKNNKNVGEAIIIPVLKAAKGADKNVKDAVKAANKAYKTSSDLGFTIVPRDISKSAVTADKAEFREKSNKWKFKLTVDTGTAKPLKIKAGKDFEVVSFDPAKSTVRIKGAGTNVTGETEIPFTRK